MKMLTKDECVKALEHLKEWGNADNADDMVTFGKLIKEHFEKGYVTAKIVLDNNKLKELVNEAIENIVSFESYKFEDLKVGMWVWDDKERKCNKIIDIDENGEIDLYYITESISRYIVQFEENRFFPVQMANARCDE